MEQLSARLSRGIAGTPFKNRPLAFILAVLLCALFVIQISLPLFIIYAACILLYSLKIGIFDDGFNIRKNPIVYVIPIALVIAVILVLPTVYSTLKISELTGERTVKAVIMQPYYEERFGSLYLAKIISIDGKALSGNITVEFTEQIKYFPYDTVTFKGVVTEAQSVLDGSELLLAKSRNLIAEVECTEFISVTNESKEGISYRTYLLGLALNDRLHELLPKKVAGYACAILLGDKTGLTDTFKSDMSALGISHILAVSGMHMSIIATIITLLADRIKTSRKLKSVIIIISALAFMTVVGFSASVVRAGIMLIISMLAVFAKGRADAITSLMLAGTVICIISPETVLSCSFMLSFFATLGIVLCALYAQQRARARLYRSKVGDMKRQFKWVRTVAFSLLVSLCATLFTAPVMSLYFSETSFVSVFTNLFAVPMAFLSMVLTLLTLIFGNVPLLGKFIINGFTFLYTVFEALVKRIADTFTTTVSLRYPFFKLCIILLSGAIIFMIIKRIRSPIAFIGALAVTAILFGGGVQIYSYATADRVEVAYIAEKNSEGMIVSSGSDTLFIDISNGSKKVTEYCTQIMENEYYETDIDGYMLTHYHSRHIATVTRVLTENKIKTLYLPEPENEKEIIFYEGLIKAAADSRIVTYERGKVLKFGRAEIVTLEYTKLERSDHPVIAMSISADSRSVAYIGASVSESDSYISADGFIAAAGAIICGSHGPTVKENDPFLSYNKMSNVYLSPYTAHDEYTLFRGGKYTVLKADKEGFALLRFSLSS